jgi:hypothetical protein
MERSIVKLFENLVAFLIFLIVPESVSFAKRRALTTTTV